MVWLLTDSILAARYRAVMTGSPSRFVFKLLNEQVSYKMGVAVLKNGDLN